MASDKLILLMRVKGAPFPEDLLQKMSDSECWRWLYSTGAVGRPVPKVSTPPEVCFTGFDGPGIEAMHLAAADKFTIKTSVTKNLKILVTGFAPGPKKIEKAKAQGCQVLTEEEFLSLLKSQGDEGQ